ncbi:MAG TPA: glutathione S-transferase family protein [Polyangiaceae bacterium]|nr:glutathione S-transferase family protein [Polyangiaceae bacterium]
MDFYTNPLSPNCRKVDAVAKQLGIPLNEKQVDVLKGGTKTPEYLALNPNGLVPTLVDGDVVLWESNAIMCYVASKTDNELWPKTTHRYEIMKWQAWELAHFGAAARALVFQRLLKPMLFHTEPDAARVEEAETNFKRFAAVLDGALAGKRFLVNNQLTLADFCVAAPLTYVAQAKLPLAGFKNAERWLAALDEQPGWRASVPPPM